MLGSHIECRLGRERPSMGSALLSCESRAARRESVGRHRSPSLNALGKSGVRGFRGSSTVMILQSQAPTLSFLKQEYS